MSSQQEAIRDDANPVDKSGYSSAALSLFGAWLFHCSRYLELAMAMP